MALMLVAEDDRPLRRLLRTLLTTESHEVLEADDGLEAWRLIQEHRPVAAILDWQMPGATGPEICARIKSDPSLAPTRVILLTGNLAPAGSVEGQEAGADAYLTKPFSPRELLAILDRLLR